MSDHAEVTLENFVVSPTDDGSEQPRQIKALANLYEERIRQMFTNTQSDRDGLLKENAVLKTKLREALDESAALEAKLREIRKQKELDDKIWAEAKGQSGEEMDALKGQQWATMMVKFHELELKCKKLESNLAAAYAEAAEKQAANNQADDAILGTIPEYFQETWHGKKAAPKSWTGEQPPVKLHRNEEPAVNVVEKEVVDDDESTEMVVTDAIVVSDD